MRKEIAVVLSLGILASCSKVADVVPEEITGIKTEEQTEMSAPLVSIVKLDEDLTSIAETDLEYVRIQLGAVEMHRLFPDAGEFEERTRREGLHRWYKVTYDNSVMTRTKALDVAETVLGVEEFEFPMPIKMQSTDLPFNDPGLTRQWHYINNGGASSVAGCDINVAPVWNNYTTGSSEVIVGVVDGGVDYTHPDLEGVVMRESSRSFNSYALTPHNHGTHVAGTIAAINNNGIGVCGIAGGNAEAGIKGSRIISCQIFAYDSEGESVGGGDSGSAIKWAADHGAVIVNNSWGYVYKTAEDAKKGGISSSDRAAIDYFNKYAGLDANGNQVGPMAGGLVLFSAGNESWEYGWPAQYEGAMAVGSFDAMGGRAYYSNYGDWVDIAAPGGSARNQQVYSTIPGGYSTMQGTSMACPHVAGVAALVVAQCGGPGFTREMLWERLVEGANKKLIPSSLRIGPAVDAMGAIAYGDMTAPETPGELSLETHSNRTFVSLTSVAAGNGSDMSAYGFFIIYGTDKDKVASATPSNLNGMKKALFVNDKNVGETFTAMLEELEFDKDYFVKAYAYSYSIVYSDASSIATTHTEPNNAPVITGDKEGPFRLRPFDSVKIKYTVSDPDGHAYTVEYEAGSDADQMVQTVEGWQVNINPSKVEPGTYRGCLVATDKYGARSELPIEYTVLPNTPPAVIKPMDNVILGKAGSTIDISLNEFFDDEDGETLRYKAESSAPSVIHAYVQNSVLNIYAMTEGSSEITVTASDAKGEKVSSSFKVVACDPGIAVALYPNPADKFLNIRTYVEDDYDVSIASRNGAVVFSTKAHISVFEPLVVDLAGFSAGTYSVSLKSQSNSYKQTFVKR